MAAGIPIDENMIKNAQQARKVGVVNIVISVRADAILQAAEGGEPEVPLCGGHAEAWFCSRDHLPGDHGCVVCAFQPAIERAALAQRSVQRARGVAEARRVGAELRRLRRALDLTQWDVAERAECTQSSIVRAEEGLAGPALVRRIAAALVKLDQEAKK